MRLLKQTSVKMQLKYIQAVKITSYYYLYIIYLKQKKID